MQLKISFALTNLLSENKTLDLTPALSSEERENCFQP